MIDSEHITYQLEEPEIATENINIQTFLSDFEKNPTPFTQDDEIFVAMKNYDLNYSVKQLLLICEYYNISKGTIRTNKMKKSDIIEQIILFEHDFKNYEVAEERKRMWFYMNEMRNNKFMKKYILWSLE